MRVLKPGQKVTLHDDPTQPVEGHIRCVTVYDDMSVQYECRWWCDGNPEVDTFSAGEIEEPDDPVYLTISVADE
jgi:hypothetical protein